MWFDLHCTNDAYNISFVHLFYMVCICICVLVLAARVNSFGSKSSYAVFALDGTSIFIQQCL